MTAPLRDRLLEQARRLEAIYWHIPTTATDDDGQSVRLYVRLIANELRQAAAAQARTPEEHLTVCNDRDCPQYGGIVSQRCMDAGHELTTIPVVLPSRATPPSYVCVVCGAEYDRPARACVNTKVKGVDQLDACGGRIVSRVTPPSATPAICMDCDGCGWCEGSPAFTCPRCKGTGLEAPPSEPPAPLSEIAQALGYPAEAVASPEALVGAVRSLVEAYRLATTRPATSRLKADELCEDCLTAEWCAFHGQCLANSRPPMSEPPAPHYWTPNETKDRCTVCGDGPWGRHRFQVQPETPAPQEEHSHETM